MNFRTTVILLFLLVIGGAVLLLTRSSQPRTETAEEAAPPPKELSYVFDTKPDPEAIVRVQVARPDKPRLVFERSPKSDDPQKLADWRLVEPLAGPTESPVVTNLASTFARVQTRSHFEPGSAGGLSAVDAGFEPPVATVALRDKDGKEYKLEVGKPAAMSTDTYVRIAGQQTIHVANRDLGREVKKPVQEYRAKTLARLTAKDAVHVRIEQAGKVYDFSRGGDSEWVMNEPARAYADGTKLAALVGRLNSLRVTEFVEDHPQSLAPFGLDEPYLTFQVTTETKRPLPAKEGAQADEDEGAQAPEDEEEEEVAEGEEPGAATQPAEPKFETVTQTFGVAVGAFADMKSTQRYVKVVDQPWVVSVPKSSIDPLEPKLTELRDARITRVKAADARRLEISARGMTAALTSQDGVWRGEGDLAELDTAAVIDVLEAFEDVRAIDYVDGATADLAKYGLDQPRAVVTVTASGAVNAVSLRIGAVTASERNTYAQVEGQPTVLVISAKQAERLAVPPLALRSRTVFDLPSEQITQVELAGERRYRLERDGGQWRMAEPDGAPLDAAGVRDLAENLARLRAKSVVAKGDGAPFGLDQPVLTVRFDVETPPTPTTTPAAEAPAPPTVTTHTLQIGRRDGAAYCRKDDDPYVFELHETVHKVLTAELIDRKLFDFAAADVVGLTVQAPGVSNELTKEDGGWKYAADPFVKLAQKKVDELINELPALRADSFITYRGGDLAAAGLGEDAPVKVTVRLKAGRQIVLHLSAAQPEGRPRKAAWLERGCVFLLDESLAAKLLRKAEEFFEGGEA